MIIGLDMGGTHIDGVIIKNDRVVKTIKKPTDREDLFKSIWSTLEELVEDYDKSDIKRINLSTTVSTNAIVEDKISKVGMIIQSGPGLKNDFVFCGDNRQFISGYIDHRGVAVEELDIGEVQDAIQLYKKRKIEACAVITKFSTRNPQYELAIKEQIERDLGEITMGHRMSGKLNFPRRVYTSYLNSAVHSTFKDFSVNIKKSLEKEGIETSLYILKADAGTMDIETAEKRPVETILSGPAASFMGISSMVETEEDSILLDIGGTTTDIFFLADGIPLFEPLGAKISDYNTLVRAIYSVSIGLGGDSSISVEGKGLKIGPERKGRPYALGGPSPTPTDAMIYLRYIDIEDDKRKKSEEAMMILGEKLNMPASKAADLILDRMGELIKNKTDELLEDINSKPVYTVRELLHGKKIEPRSISIIGGPANVLAGVLEKLYNLPCKFPPNYDVANAIGAALAKPTLDITMTADTEMGVLSVSELGVHEKISNNYSIDDAKERAIELLKEAAISMGMDENEIEAEITEESSFNMVRGFSTSGKNIRIKAQIKPGHILKLRSGNKNES